MVWESDWVQLFYLTVCTKMSPILVDLSSHASIRDLSCTSRFSDKLSNGCRITKHDFILRSKRGVADFGPVLPPLHPLTHPLVCLALHLICKFSFPLPPPLPPSPPPPSPPSSSPPPSLLTWMFENTEE